jgi:uncharacterized protein YodC (DUF2158 family)
MSVRKFKSGDVVALKSGGHKMTVTLTRRDGLAAKVAWFDGAQVNERWFMNDVLKAARANKVDEETNEENGEPRS